MASIVEKYERNRTVDVEKLVSFTVKNPKPGHEGKTVTCDVCGGMISQGGYAYAGDTYYSPSADSPLDFCGDCIPLFNVGLFLPSAGAYAACVAEKLFQKAKEGQQWHVNAKSDFDEEAFYARNGSSFMARVESRLINEYDATVDVQIQTIDGKKISTGLEVSFPDLESLCVASLSTPTYNMGFAMPRGSGEYITIDKKKN